LYEDHKDLPKLVLVGKPVGNYNLPLERLKYFNLESKVLLLNDLSDNELAYLYQNASINIVPSLHEGFGLAALEGMQFGCPPIDHKYTSTSEISSLAGIHIDMRSKHELAAAIKNLLEDKSLITELKEYCNIQSKKFTWESSCSTLISYYLDQRI
jgi:glycosyltransferase involved in cell wall biosynthesis